MQNAPREHSAILLTCINRVEKYLNWEGLLEKSLKIKSALKSTLKSLRGLEKSLNSNIFFRTVDRDLNQNKIVMPLFGAAYAAPNKSTTILYKFSSTYVSIMLLRLVKYP